MIELFDIIYADPPWAYNDKLDDTRTLKYPTMTLEQIAALRVDKLCAGPGCALFMWATFPTLPDALKVINAWGFTYKTAAFVWVKVNKLTEVNQASFFPADSFDDFLGMGHWSRANAEIVLVATRGKIKRENADVRQIIYAPIDEHSRKPPETRERIVRLMGDRPRVELFARQTVAGWRAWGNQVESDITLR